MTNPDLVALANELDDIETDAAGKCNWSEVPTVSDALRRLASSDSGVKVRGLEWKRSEPFDNVYKADRYFIRVDRGPPDYYIVSGWDSGTNPHDTLEAAKAAAQADYEARIRSALITAPPADAGMREALDNSQSLLVMVNHIGPKPELWETEEMSTLLVEQIMENRKALTAPGATTKSGGGATVCERCQGNGEIVTDWDSYLHPADLAAEEASVADCPDCDGEGKITTSPSDPSSTRSDPNEQAYADLIASGGIFPEAYQQGGAPMTDDKIKHMVDRFLGWKLPEDFNPDCGISFKRTHSEQSQWGPQKYEPIGTNLFDATQATEMVRHMLEGLPSTRSEVTVESIARTIEPSASGYTREYREAMEIARALLDQFEIRRK